MVIQDRPFLTGGFLSTRRLSTSSCEKRFDDVMDLLASQSVDEVYRSMKRPSSWFCLHNVLQNLALLQHCIYDVTHAREQASATSASPGHAGLGDESWAQPFQFCMCQADDGRRQPGPWQLGERRR